MEVDSDWNLIFVMSISFKVIYLKIILSDYCVLLRKIFSKACIDSSRAVYLKEGIMVISDWSRWSGSPSMGFLTRVKFVMHLPPLLGKCRCDKAADSRQGGFCCPNILGEHHILNGWVCMHAVCFLGFLVFWSRVEDLLQVFKLSNFILFLMV